MRQRPRRLSLRTAAIVLSVFSLFSVTGCWRFLPETLEDVLVNDDGTLYIATSEGRLLASANHGVDWQEKKDFSGSLSTLAAGRDGTIWAIHNKPYGRSSLIFAPNSEVVVSCDAGSTFETISASSDFYPWDAIFVTRPDAHPIALLGGRLFEPSPPEGCPEALHEFGMPNPTGYVESAVVCGEKIYEASSARVFSSADNGETWDLEWDFFTTGQVHLECEYDQVWAYHESTTSVVKQMEVGGDFVSVGAFAEDSYCIVHTFLRLGYFFAVGLDCAAGIRSMTQNGTIQEWPSPSIGNDEYLMDFDIAPDGIFWVATNLALYHDNPDANWTKAWP